MAKEGEPYRWQKGQSGNPSGRPKKLPVTERYQALLEVKLPKTVLARLSSVVGEELPEETTFGDALVLTAALEAIGTKTGAALDYAREIREAVEGRATQRLEILNQEEVQDVDELRRMMREKLINTMVERSKLYGMPLPTLTETANEAGVELDIPIEKESRK